MWSDGITCITLMLRLKKTTHIINSAGTADAINTADDSTIPLLHESGGQAVLSKQLVSYGFPITKFELRLLVVNHLTGLGQQVPCLENNIPGDTWAKSF